MIKAIIIDDERGAFINLSNLLSTYCKEVEIMGYANNTVEAEVLLKTEKPDLIFLDIQMPGETGIDFIKRLLPIDFEVVFVTAYDEFALKVFKLNALDYILKPINVSYLQESMQRAAELIAEKRGDHDKAADERFLSLHQKKNDSLVLKDGYKRKRFQFDEIAYLHASGSYTVFHFKGHPDITSAYNLAHYVEILPEDIFIKTHKSYVANKYLIQKITTIDNAPHCRLINNDVIPISRRRLSTVKSNWDEIS